jgi:hypothetical protein
LAGGVGVRNEAFGFTIAWAPNTTLVVEACTDLNRPDWSPVNTNTPSDGLWVFSDPEWTNYPARFYRLKAP